MEPFEDDKLVRVLESLRPEPRPDFAAELDERAAAGFPRRSGLSPWRRLAERLRATEPRRALIPAGATALAAIAAVTVVLAIGENGADRPAGKGSLLSLSSDGNGASAPSAQPQAGNARSGAEPQAAEPPGHIERPPEELASAAAATAKDLNLDRPKVLSLSRSGPYASQARRREIERSAQVILGAEPTEVRKAASEVFETVHAYRGIVLSSSIRDGDEGEAGARFSLLIPSAKLGDAMADFSAIGEVRSRREATADITAPTVRTGELLRDSRATIEGLLVQLAAADTDAERVATEAKLQAERRHAAYLRSQLSGLQRRANLSRVQLRIESGAAAASSDDRSWGVSDALGDAGQILAIAAGVTIVGLAVIGPIALLALLAWLANRARIRRARDRALA
jgi:Domain of unknown function (DUF4349)